MKASKEDVKLVVRQIIEYYFTGTNDSHMRAKISKHVGEALDKLVYYNLIHSYEVVCDSHNNTTEMIKNSIIQVNVGYEDLEGDFINVKCKVQVI